MQELPETTTIWQFGAARATASSYTIQTADDLGDSGGLLDMYDLQFYGEGAQAELQLIARDPNLDFRTSETLDCSAPVLPPALDTNFARLCLGGDCAQGTVESVALAPAPPPAAAGRMYFVADDGVHGSEVWLTDCTPQGTVLAGDVNPIVGSGSSFDMTGCLEFERDSLYCEMLEADCGMDPTSSSYCGFDYSGCMSSVGSRAMCQRFARDCQQLGSFANEFCLSGGGGGAGSNPQQLTRFGGWLYFSADDGLQGRELWRTDGTTTALVENLRIAELPGIEDYAASAMIPRMAVLGDVLYFTGRDDTHGFELFKTTGAIGPGAITLALDLNPSGEAGGNPAWLTVAGDRLYMEVDNPPSGQDELHWIDTSGASGEIPLPRPSVGSQALVRLVGVGDKLFFQANDSSGTPRLFVVPDDSATEAVDLGVTLGQSFLEPSRVASLGGSLFVPGTNGSDSGLFVSDGTLAGTRFLGPAGITPVEYLTAAGSQVFFQGWTAGASAALYGTDGSGPAVNLGGGPVTYLVDHAGTPFFRGQGGQDLEAWSVAAGRFTVWNSGAFIEALASYPASSQLLVLRQAGDFADLVCVDVSEPTMATSTVVLGVSAPGETLRRFVPGP